MLRTIIWFIYFWIYLIFIQLDLLKAKRLAKTGQTLEHDLLVDQTAKKWARSLVRLTGTTIKVTGEENVPKEGPVLFVSNHQGNFDIPILLGHIKKPKAFIAKVELLKLPMIRTWMVHMKCVFIDRSDVRQSLRVINQAAEFLKEGYSMVIFPEGTRSKGDKLGDFKPGSLKLALKAGVPIVPIKIQGSYRIMEQNGFIIKPALVEISIFEPIPTADLSKQQASELTERVRTVIEQEI